MSRVLAAAAQLQESRNTLMTANFPRLLVATEFPPNAPGGGPAVVRQMLQGWPEEKLFWWSCLPDKTQKFGRRVAGHAVAAIPPKLYPRRRWRSPRCWLMKGAWTPRAAGHLRKTLDTVKPDVVWMIPHAWSIPPLARVFLESNVRFHVSIHDYADVQGAVDSFGLNRCRWMAGLTDQLYARAATRDAICQAMVDDLRQRTGATGVINRAGLEPHDFSQLDAPLPAVADTIRIGYAGTIIVEPEFALFVAAMERIRQQLPKPVALEFFGDHSYRTRPWFNPAWMTEHGNLALPELSAALRNCSWGFSPMALADDNPRYNRFSLPTKFVSYLAAGLPIISLGHPESSVVQMAAAHDVGLCSTTDDAEALSQQLRTALSEPDPRAKYRPNLRRCALEEFDAQRMRQALHAALAGQS
ncbi:MAG TPA: hypothetical protein VF988_00230 [Verrucomicrobiae bacterium]